jgi:hypothetical protein
MTAYILTFISQVKAKSSKWHTNLESTTPIILGTVPLTSYQPPVIQTGVIPPGQVNGETPNVPAGTGGTTVPPLVGPPPVGEPQASENTGWNIPPSDPNAQSQGVPYIQPNMAPEGPAPASSLYPDLCTYGEFVRFDSPFYKQIILFYIKFMHVFSLF